MGRTVERNDLDWEKRVAQMRRQRLGGNGVKGTPIGQLSESVLAEKIRTAFGYAAEPPTSVSGSSERAQTPWWLKF